MTNISINFTDGKVISASKHDKVLDILESQKINTSEIVGVKIDNLESSVFSELEFSCQLEPIYLNTKDGAEIYRRSLCLLLATAVEKIFPGTRVLVGHSLGYGYYYTLENGKDIEDKQVEMITTKMKALVKKDIPFNTERLSYQQAMEIFEVQKLTGARLQMDFNCPPYLTLNELEGFYDISSGPLVPSTSYLKCFDLMKYQNGFLLRFPKSEDHSVLPEFIDQPKLFETYSRYKEWGKKIGITNAAELNVIAMDKHKIADFIDITETFQQKNISKIASEIVDSKAVKVVLIAGPSSSGKTTTSKKLALELQALGLTPKLISLDNYYLGFEKTPKDENGKPDFECLEALNVELLNQNLIDLFDGKEVNIPSYDFHTSSSFFEEKNKMKLGENDILIMEGIHGLNPKLTAKIPDQFKYRIYLSALTQLNLDDHNRISTSDNRLIRRIVRDWRYRGKSAAGTISMWPSVQAGEKKHIFPFQNNADAILNTALDYELSVLKVYAMPLLRCVKPSQTEYAVASHLIKFLDRFCEVPAASVPDRSIIREFIGGSSFKY